MREVALHGSEKKIYAFQDSSDDPLSLLAHSPVITSPLMANQRDVIWNSIGVASRNTS